MTPRRRLDVLIRPVMMAGYRLIHLDRRVELAILGLISPSTKRVMTPIFLGWPPQRPETLSPAVAGERYGYDKPAEAHRQWRQRQRARVAAGRAPSDAGLIESEALLGAMSSHPDRPVPGSPDASW